MEFKPGGLFLTGERPVVVGTGFVALDVVVTDREEDGPRQWTGGTCGNVLAILGYLGWKSYPIASLGDDPAARWILADLGMFGVDTRYVECSSNRRTPIVVELLRTRGRGAPRHRFLWRCPSCGARLPGFRAVDASVAARAVETVETPSLVFIDRATRRAIELAADWGDQGAVVVFEPSGIGNERLFKEAVAASHVVKYSSERLGKRRGRVRAQPRALEIETKGRDGLRYRRRDGARAGRWAKLPGFPVGTLRDSVGAGDWCTAGLVHRLCVGGSAGLESAPCESVEAALSLGQAMAAVKCGYEGARGPMYSLSRLAFERAVDRVLSGTTDVADETDVESRVSDAVKAVCPGCVARME